jgi:hypothetical protein
MVEEIPSCECMQAKNSMILLNKMGLHDIAVLCKKCNTVWHFGKGDSNAE